MLHTVIKGTKTIAEFKEVKEKMESLTEKYYQDHKSAWENLEERRACYRGFTISVSPFFFINEINVSNMRLFIGYTAYYLPLFCDFICLPY